MRDKIYSAVFGITLFALLLFAPLKYTLVSFNIISYTDLGNYSASEKDCGDGFYSAVLNTFESGENSINDIYTNYLPFYVDAVSGFRSFELLLNSPLSGTLKTTAALSDKIEAPDDSEELDKDEPADSKNSGDAVYILEDGRHRIYSVELEKPVVNSVTGETVTKFFDRAILIQTNELEQRVKKQAAQVNRIAAINKDINFYVYLGTRFQECEDYDNYLQGEHNVKGQRDEFLSLLDENIRRGYLHINGIQDRVDKIYLTDHHWTPYGAHCAYTDIIEMMASDTPELGEPREYIKYDFIDNCRFFGSTARTAGLYNFIWDSFYFYEYDLPAYTTKPANDLQQQIKRYLSGKFDKTPGADHYQTVFTAKNEFKTETPENKRVLLMFGDSFSYSTAYLIASHFSRVIIVNPSTITGEYKYSTVIKKYNVTDVLILLISDRLYGDVYNNTPLTNIVDK